MSVTVHAQRFDEWFVQQYYALVTEWSSFSLSFPFCF